jgi:hypothetical protein
VGAGGLCFGCFVVFLGGISQFGLVITPLETRINAKKLQKFNKITKTI